MTKFANKLKVQLPLALGLSLISSYSIKLPSYSADSLLAPAIETTSPSIATAKLARADIISIKNIYLNESKQLVVEFDNPNQLTILTPQVKDYPGQKHDIVLEFLQTSFAVDKAPKAKAVLDSLMRVYPDLTSVAYATATDGTRARIRLGISPTVSAHPTLVKIDQTAAIINLDLNAVVKTASASGTVSAAPAETNNESAPHVENQVITAKEVTPPGEAPKTVHGIKGALSSVNKFGKISKLNPLAKFGHNKANEQLSTPTNKDIVTNNVKANAVKEETLATPDQSAPTAEQSQSKIDLLATLKEPVDTSVNQATTTPEEPTAIIAASPSAPATTTINSNPEKVKAELASLKPEILSNEAPSEVKDTLAVMPVAKAATDLPVIATDTKEPIITPLSVEQVLKEKAASEAANPKITAQADSLPNQSISVEAQADKSVISDLKTSFSAPEKEPAANPKTPAQADSLPNQSVPVEAQANKSVISDLKTSFSAAEKEPTNMEKIEKENLIEKVANETKKEDTEKVASVPPNPLDSLTGAAISNAKEKEEGTSEDIAQSQAAVKLKSQKAHVGGKDYFPPKFDDDAVDHYNAAVRAHLNGKLTEAITEYQAAIEADEKIGEAHSNLGLIYNQMHKYELAMVEFHKALVINPKDAITFNGIGAAMRAKNNLVAAIKNWQTAITLDPNLASAHYNLGTAYELNKDLDKALAQYKEAVKHDDKLGEAYYRAGLILQKMNNKNLALEEYKQAVKISQQASYASDAKRRINLLSQSKNNTM